MPTVLAGDIGGTHARLAYFEVEGRTLRLSAAQVFESRAHAGLCELVGAMRKADPRPIVGAAFGVAGPVREGACEAPNLAWSIEARALAEELGLAHVGLVNDLEANAFGIAYLGEADFTLLQGGTAEVKGHLAVVSAGTGLGQSGLFWDGTRHRPFASEGGHVDFAPRNALEAELWRWLSAREDHVSWEKVVSGPGLCNLHRFLIEHERATEPAWLGEASARGDPAAAIAQAALSEKDERCQRALDWFIELYGAAAGNVALQFYATGGVYVGGGIAPRLLPRLKESGRFQQAFVAKGRMRPMLEQIPVRVITQDKAALWGAGHVAAFEPRRV